MKSIELESLPADLVETVLSHRRTLASKIKTLADQSNLVVFDGQLMTSREARDLYRSLQKRNRRVLCEVLLVLALMLGIAASLWSVLNRLCS